MTEGAKSLTFWPQEWVLSPVTTSLSLSDSFHHSVFVSLSPCLSLILTLASAFLGTAAFTEGRPGRHSSLPLDVSSREAPSPTAMLVF